VGSDLQKADLRGALLQGANLGGARLAYAQLGEAQLKGADLFGSSLYNAFLPRADLKGADLRMANLRGTAFYDANLHGVSFDSADLTDVHLQGAVIKYADFQLATAVPAKEEILKSRDWNLAFFPSGMLAQLGLPPDHNEKLEQQMCADPTAVTNEQASFRCSILRRRSQKAASPESRQQPKPATGGSPAVPPPKPQPKPSPVT
jgi:hypothetical protein